MPCVLNLAAMKHLFCILLVLILGVLPAQAAVPTDCTQAILGIAEGWNSSHVTVSVVEKNAQGQWVRVLGPYKGRLGKNGLIWGLGLHNNPRKAATKKEGDGRSPAGIFTLGGLWVTHKTPVKHHRSIPYVKVGPNDIWVTNTSDARLYNRHVRLKHAACTKWELKEQMRQTDYPHSIKMLICHNTPERKGGVVVGGGAAIFFHIWRNNGNSATAGCTSMAEENLRAIIARLNPARKPVYILLPKSEYMRLRQEWRLP